MEDILQESHGEMSSTALVEDAGGVGGGRSRRSVGQVVPYSVAIRSLPVGL